ncbi:Bladder cancer-associated protein [Strongyloides ratti]|uniref:Bladder cancer-associated protein n=2 Tax=Strongyloides TaxID=6247 RepID=A0A090LF16_STRRB|nr:Bladder cancer-associated protein [Strongyloides ratti]CEF66708.1 Bladder cancer-associated protein [Strongyloides ratti]
MYCLQWLLPLFLIPKVGFHPDQIIERAILSWIYLIGFFIERRPCHVCTAAFIIFLLAYCYSDPDNCVFYPFCKTTKNGEACEVSTY